MDEILLRRSVRKYDLSKRISYDDLLDLCKYAEAAPSARKQKSREYIIIDDKRIIDELSNVSHGSMLLSECNTVIAVIAKNPNELSTPHMMVQDLSAAVENILLRATQKGFGSCWIGIHPLEERITAANKILNVTNGKNVFALIALGYPQDKENCFYDANKFDLGNVYHNRY
ncbi:MAG: nitroreductase family protein [Anaeroplasma sp.]